MLSGKITTDHAWFAVRFMAYLTEGNLLLPPKQMEQVGFEEANASLVLSISLTILYWTVLHQLRWRGTQPSSFKKNTGLF